MLTLRFGLGRLGGSQHFVRFILTQITGALFHAQQVLIKLLDFPGHLILLSQQQFQPHGFAEQLLIELGFLAPVACVLGLCQPQESFILHFSNYVGGDGIGDVFLAIVDRPTLGANISESSAQKGVVQELTLNAGSSNAGRRYFIAGSLGTTPGFALHGVHVPVNADNWFATTLSYANASAFHRFRGILDANGSAKAQFVIDPNNARRLLGSTIYHAYVVYDPLGQVHVASNPVSLTIVRGY